MARNPKDIDPILVRYFIENIKPGSVERVRHIPDEKPVKTQLENVTSMQLSGNQTQVSTQVSAQANKLQ